MSVTRKHPLIAQRGATEICVMHYGARFHMSDAPLDTSAPPMLAMGIPEALSRPILTQYPAKTERHLACEISDAQRRFLEAASPRDLAHAIAERIFRDTAEIQDVAARSVRFAELIGCQLQVSLTVGQEALRGNPDIEQVASRVAHAADIEFDGGRAWMCEAEDFAEGRISRKIFAMSEDEALCLME